MTWQAELVRMREPVQSGEDPGEVPYYPLILCSDERTYALLEDFCKKTKVKVSIHKDIMQEPDEVKVYLKTMVEQNVLPEDVAKKLRKKLKF